MLSFVRPRTSSSCNRPTSCFNSALRIRSVASGMVFTSWTFNLKSLQAASTASSRELLLARSAAKVLSPHMYAVSTALVCVSSGEPSLIDPKSPRALALAPVRVEPSCVTSSREWVFRSVCSKRCSKRMDNNSEWSSASPFLVVIAQCSSCARISPIAISSCVELTARPASGRSGRGMEAREAAAELLCRTLGAGSERWDDKKGSMNLGRALADKAPGGIR